MSLIDQFMWKDSKVPDVVRNLYHIYAGGPALPSVQALQEVIFLAVSVQACWHIVLDGIDECSEREALLSFVRALRRYGTENDQDLRILVTSRNLKEIDVALTEDHTDGPIFSMTIDARDDVESLIRRELDRRVPQFGVFPPDLKHQILNILSRKSDGWCVHCLSMHTIHTNTSGPRFLWARLALHKIYQAPTLKAVKQFLEDPLPDLESSYIDLIREIPPQHDELVRRVLIWITSSARPLTLEEVSHAIVINKTGNPVNPEERLSGSDLILETCSNFLTQTIEMNNTTGKPHNTLRLLHTSFKDFLESTRSEQLQSPLLGLQDFNGDRVLADCCISYLLGLNEETLVGLEEESVLLSGQPSGSTLLAYAAMYWPYHARRIENNETRETKTTELIMRLFHQNNGNTFASWLKLYDPENSGKEVKTPLYYASLLGLRHVLELLIETEGHHSALDLEAGLHVASSNGYADIVLLLLEKGASPNAERLPGDRPLDDAILKRFTPIVELLLYWKVDVTYKDGITDSPFLTAISTGDTRMVSLMFGPTKASLPPEEFLDHVSQGLRDAARNGHLEIVQFLFNSDQKADLDAADKAGWTALHYAIRYKHDYVQQYLIDHGADFDKRNLAGETPADFAWSDRRLDLSLYNKTIDLRKEARQAFSCHILQQVSDSRECAKVRHCFCSPNSLKTLTSYRVSFGKHSD